MIQAKIIADSVNAKGNRITSFLLTYPRFIHSELMTHRMLSRNAASSRAIPVEKMIHAIKAVPAYPLYWGKAQKGMQTAEEVDEFTMYSVRNVWMNALSEAVVSARKLLELGLHKSIANRLLEPFAHMETLVTATEWTNFYSLRAHKDAEPTFQCLAYLMLQRYTASIPQIKKDGEWHVPFNDEVMEGLDEQSQLEIATARAARTSYKNFEGKVNLQDDVALHDRLKESGHWSPFEHCACARSFQDGFRSGNFVGWDQYRKLFKHENRTEVNYKDILDNMPAFVKRELAKVPPGTPSNPIWDTSQRNPEVVKGLTDQ